MEVDEMREEVIKHILRKPFEPFVVAMKNGECHDVPSRFVAAVGDKTMVVLKRHSPTSTWLRLDQIASLQTIKY